MKHKILASLRNTDTGGSCVVICTGRVWLSLLEMAFGDFEWRYWRRLISSLPKNHVVRASALSSVCGVMLVEFLWMRVQMQESREAFPGIAFVKLPLFYVTFGICACWTLWRNSCVSCGNYLDMTLLLLFWLLPRALRSSKCWMLTFNWS